jgi:hypothetical protein
MKKRANTLTQTALAVVVLTLVPHAATVPYLSASGWGPVKIGMSIAATEKALNARVVLDDSASGSNACIDAWAGSDKRPNPPLHFRFVDGKLAVIGILNDSIATDSGIRIGDPETKVFAKYGAKLLKEPAPYYDESAPQHRLFFWQSPDRGLLFEIDENGKIQHIEGGTSALNAIEGCA